MTTIFSFVFGVVFLAFIIAAIVGHALLLGAYVRPFFGKLSIAKRPLPSRSRLVHAR